MTYLDDQGYEPDIYPPHMPGPPPRGRGIIGAMGFQSRRTQENEARKWGEYRQRMQIYQQKLYERQMKERERAEKEQEKMARDHRAEQVKIAEEQAKFDEAVASAKHAQDRLNQLSAAKEKYLAEPQKTSPVFGQLQKQLNDAKAKATKAKEAVENRYRLIKPLLDRTRGSSPPEKVPGMFAGVFGDSDNPAYQKYAENLDKALELDRGIPKGTPGQKEMPSFPELSSAARAAQENIGAKEMSIAEQQERMERSRQEGDRRVLEPIETQRSAAQKELTDAQAKQQAARQILDAYKKGGTELPQGSPVPQGGISGGNVQRASPMQPSFTPSGPQMQPQLGGGQSGVSAGGKGAIPIPIIGPIISAVGSALAGGKGGGGVMGPAGQGMPPQRPAGGLSPLSPSTVAPPLRFQPEQWSPLSPSLVSPSPAQFERPQMQAGQPPAIEQPAPAQMAGGDGAPVVVGDSIGDGIRQGLGAQGDTKVGRSPERVLEAIQANPKMFSGRDVVLSSGASNNPKGVGLLAKQIQALKAAGAKSISVTGVGDRKDFRGLNDQIENIARMSGARFLGPLKGLSGDHVHPRSYQNIINQIRRPSPSPGAENGRGAPPNVTRPRAAGRTGQPPVFAQLQGGTAPPSMGGSDADRRAISGIESGGSYSKLGPVTRKGDRAYGKYQVMGSNVGPWTSKYFGQWLNPQQFLQNPKAQEAVFGGEFGRLKGKYGGPGAARAWFGGEGGMNQLSRRDQLGTSVGDYGRRYAAAAGGGGAAPPMTQMAGANIPAPESMGGGRVPQAPQGFARGSGKSFDPRQMMPGGMPGMQQMMGMVGGSGQKPQQQPSQQAQKQVNPIAAGLSAIQPPKPTVELSEPSGGIQPPATIPHQFTPLPLLGHDAGALDHAAMAGLKSGLSRKDLIARMQKAFPNDQLPAWLMQQQQQQQQEQAVAPDAGE